MSGIHTVAALVAHISLVLASTTIVVNPRDIHQTIDGFGMSEAFWQASTVQGLNSSAQKATLDLLFSNTAGAGLSILRNRIGAGGSGDSIEPTSPGDPAADPAYVWDNYDAGQLWLSQQARSYGVRYIYADAWSAPSFMKTNNDQSNGGYLCSVASEQCLSGDWRQAYADFLTQYLAYYKTAGITIDVIGFINEPELTTPYESMLMNASQAAGFIPILYNELKSKNFSATGIACCDSMGWDHQVNMTSQIQTSGSERYLSRITSHLYSSQCSSKMPTALRVWETEYADLSGALSNDWYSTGAAGEGLTWANNIFKGLTSCNLSAYLYWWGTAPNATQNGQLIDLVDNYPVPSGRLWAFGMFSRYVKPDATRLGLSAAPVGVNAVAFRNIDGSIPVVIINTNNATQTIRIAISGRATAKSTAYVTSSSSEGILATEVVITGGHVAVDVPDHAMVTVVVW